MFAPADRPRVAVASDGSLAAFAVVRTITIVELATGTPIAERQGDEAARAIEIGWLDALVLVLNRHGDHTVAWLWDPWADRVVSELRLDERLRLLATMGPYALVGGVLGGAVLSSAGGLTHGELPIGSVMAAGVAVSATVSAIAGAAAQDFVIATEVEAGAEIIGWDPGQQRVTRRSPVTRPVTRIGGHARALWMTPVEDPARIDVVRLGGTGRPFSLEFPEPIIQVADHPTGDPIACLGESGRLYLVDLVEHARPRVVEVAALDRVEAVAVLERRRLLVARGLRPISIVDLEGRALAPALWWDARWREDIVAWTRAVVAGSHDRRAPAALPIDVVVRRLGVSGALRAAIVLLYGAHLGGSHGVAPSDVAKVVEGPWAEALGRGQLAGARIASLVDSRVCLAGAIVRALDELPPSTGILVGDVAVRGLAGPCVVVAPEDEPLADVASRCAAELGALLVAHERADLVELVFEARVRGAAAMVRLAPGHEASADPVVFVCAEEERAGELGVLGIRRVPG